MFPPPRRQFSHSRCAALLTAALTTSQALAVTVTWTPATSGTWFDAAHWSSNPSLPSASDDVLMSLPGAYTVTYDSTGPATAVNSLTLNSASATLKLSPGPANPFSATNGITLTAGTLELAANWNDPALPSITQTGGTLRLGSAWTNAGSISATGGTVTFSGAFTNSGSISASNAFVTFSPSITPVVTGPLAFPSSFVVLSGPLTGAQLTNLSANSPGATFNFTNATVDNSTGITLPVSAPTWFVRGSTFNNGTLSSAKPITEQTPPGAVTTTLNNVQLNAPWIVSSATLLGAGVNANLITVNNTARLTVYNNWANAGTVDVKAGGTLNLAGLFSNTGAIRLRSATLSISGLITLASMNTLDLDAATIVRLEGGTIDLGGAAHPTIPGTPFTGPGYLANGTLDTAYVGSLTGVSLKNITLTGAGTLQSSRNAHNALTLANATVTIPTSKELEFYPSMSVLGTGSFILDGGRLDYASSSSRITFGPGITVRTSAINGGSVGSVPFPDTTNLIFEGLLSSQTGGKTLTLRNAQIAPGGTLEARNGGAVDIPVSVANFSAGTLTDGHYNVYAGSSLTLPPAAAITTNAAHILLSGPTSSFPALSALTTNAGSLTLTAGRSFTAASNLTNSGSITLGPTSALTVPGTLSFTAPAATLTLESPTQTQINAVRSNIFNAKYVTPLLNLTLGYLYTGDPAIPTSLLVTPALPGDANLDGSVDPDDYALLDQSFALSLPNPRWWNGDFNHDAQLTSADYQLIDQTFGQTHGFSPGLLAQRRSQFGDAYVQSLLVSIPEPSSLAVYALAILPWIRSHRKLRSVS